MVIDDRGSHAAILVLDSGQGISNEDLPMVFERFYQTKLGRRAGGTGLGLAIARRIVEAHSGAIVAANKVGGGTAITMTFPILQGADA